MALGNPALPLGTLTWPSPWMLPAMGVLVLSHTYIVDLNREKLRALAQLSSGLEVVVGVPRRWQPGGVQNRLIVSEPVVEGNFRVQPLSHLSQNNRGLLTFGPDLVQLLRQFRPQVIQVEQGARALAYAQTITLNRLLVSGPRMCSSPGGTCPTSSSSLSLR
jgi:hypothetical protein